MPWHIISIGDEAYLFKIFQFLSMLNSPGTSLYAKMGMLGALIGLMLILFQSVTSAGKQFNAGSLLLGVALFTVMFGTSTSVTLEDFHTGRTDIVTGVPMGTAIVGTLVSQAGVEVINLFQQGTAVPGQEVMPADYALEALGATRGLTSGAVCTDNSGLCPFTRTLSSYVKDCVFAAYNGVGRSGMVGWWAGDPSTSSTPMQSIATTNTAITTSDSLQGTSGNPTTQTCKTTYQDIQTASKSTAVTDAMAGQLLAAAHQSVPAGAAPGTATAQAVQLLSNSYGALLGGADTSGSQSDGQIAGWISQAQSEAGNVMLTATVAQALHDAAERNRGMTASDLSNAAIIESAAQQRNVKYAAEESMFGRTLTATMAFFEGVIYGMAPFIAFLVPLGAIGIKFLMRYLQLLIWLFLWLPLLSFVNLFEIMSVMRTMNALAPARAGGALTSMVGIMEVQSSVGDWIALGGWLTTSVIGLSGMIVFGSVAAFSSIAGAAHGPDSVDPSGAAPQITDHAPLIQGGADYSGSGGAAMMSTGSSMTTLSAQNGLSYAASMKHQQIVASLVSHGMSRGLAEKASWQDASKWANDHALSDNFQAGVGQQSSNTRGDAVDARDATGNTVQTAKNVGAGANVTVKAGTPGEGLLGVGVSASADAHTSIDHRAGGDQSSSIGSSKSVGTQQSKTALDSQTTGESNGASTSVGGGYVYDSSHSEAWNKSLQNTLSDLKSYDTAMSESSSIGSAATVSSAQIGADLPRNEAAMGSVRQAVSDLNGDGYFHRLDEQLQASGHYPIDEQRHAVASMMTLEHLSSDSSQPEAVRMEATKAMLGGMQAVNPELGSSLTQEATSFLTSGSQMSGVTSATSGVQSEVSGAMSGKGGALDHSLGMGNHGSIESQHGATVEKVGAATQEVAHADGGNFRAVEAQGDEAVKLAKARQAQVNEHAGEPSMLTGVGEMDSLTKGDLKPQPPHPGGSTGSW